MWNKQKVSKLKEIKKEEENWREEKSKEREKKTKYNSIQKLKTLIPATLGQSPSGNCLLIINYRTRQINAQNIVLQKLLNHIYHIMQK